MTGPAPTNLMQTCRSLLTAFVLGGTLVAQAPQKPQPPAPRVEQGRPEPGPPDQGPPDQAGPKQDKPAAKPQAPNADQPAKKVPEPGPPAKPEATPPVPVPKGTDPADLAAMRSAEKMLDAERKLAKLIEEGKLKGVERILPFGEISAWRYEDGLEGMPAKVRALSGKKVLMTGFMLPIDEVQNIKEFLLVKSLWACCYGQPPDINGLVRCVMPGKKRTDYFLDPVRITGEFKVEATMLDGYCVDIYQLHVASIEPVK